MNLLLRILVLVAALATWSGTAAQVLRVASQGDAMSMDPHAHNESVTLSLLGNVYEPLVARSADLHLVPGLAVSWRQVSPLVWRFELRQHVRFHDGTPFGPDDVVFSLRRAMERAEFRVYVGDIRDVRIASAHAVDVELRAPAPTLPDALTFVYMMSRAWCEAVGAAHPSDRLRGTENAASFRANGTGPFRLRERQPDVRTTLTRNGTYWGRFEGNVREVVFLPIANPATRVAALLSGEADVIDPVPLHDIEAVNRSGRASVATAPEMRIVFLGMDQTSEQWRSQRNPLRDRRVRQAIYQAIDVDALRKQVMGGAATPTALMIAPGVRGYATADDHRLPYDLAAARALLAQAGWGDGFDMPMNCPSDRYVNDEALCQAIAAQLARAGIRVRLEVETKSTYFPKVLGRHAAFYLLGWAPATYDALNVLQALVVCPDGQGAGYFNAGGYCNPKVDELVRAAQQEAHAERRDALLRQALQLHASDVGHIPLHRQWLAWGVRNGVHVVLRPDDMMFFSAFSVPAGGSP